MVRALVITLCVISWILAFCDAWIWRGEYGEDLDTSTLNSYNRLVDLESIDNYYHNYQRYVKRNESFELNNTFGTYKAQAVDTLLGDVSRGDAKRYRRAFDYLMEQSYFSSGMIVKLHQLLSDDQGSSGVYRRSDKAWDNSKNMFLSYEKIPSAMDTLVDQVNHELLVTPNIDVWGKAAWLHYRLNIIHPFDAYNSHVAALLANWFMLKVFSLPFPINLYGNSHLLQKQTLALKYRDSSLLAKLYLETINWNFDSVFRSYNAKMGLLAENNDEEDEYGGLVMYSGIREFQKGTIAQEFIFESNNGVQSLTTPTNSLVGIPYSSPTECKLSVSSSVGPDCYYEVINYTPIERPTNVPILPSLAPSSPPVAPTAVPSALPTPAPITSTRIPTAVPTAIPTRIPTAVPTAIPTRIPTRVPTAVPTRRPSAPSSHPTSQPSSQPSGQPSSQPSSRPSTSRPSSPSTRQPSVMPTAYPSLSPSTAFIISTIAGTGSTSYSGDSGQATSATLGAAEGVAVDSAGNVYVSDTGNHRVRKVTVSTGIITTIAGIGSNSYNGDNGQATSAAINFPSGLAIDASGNIYIADNGNNRVRKVAASTTIITTLAGSASSGYTGDNGQATAATLRKPYSVAVDSSGNIYIADMGNNCVRKVTTSTGIITTFAGTGTASYSGDGSAASSAGLNGPLGVGVDSSGNVYIADTSNSVIRKVAASTGIITTIAGTGVATYNGDGGQATAAALKGPQGVVVDSSGNVYISDTYNSRIRKIATPTGIISLLAGSGTSSYSGDGGDAAAAALYKPYQVALDTSGNVYIADQFNNRIRKVTVVSTSSPSNSPTRTPTPAPSSAAPTAYPSLSPSTAFIISTIAGTGTGSYSGDNGAATAAALFYPEGVAVDPSGNIYIGDTPNNRVRKVTLATGIISTIAGTGTSSYGGDGGAATSAMLDQPTVVSLDAAGNVYVADLYNYRIRKVTVSTSVITTVAGTGASSFSGDNGAATSATLALAYGVGLDASDNVYIGDTNNHRIRKVTASTGIITTIAGTGTGGYSGDNGAATSAKLNQPTGVSLDSSGNVYVADHSNNRIRKVTVSTGIITLVAGTGSTSYSGDNGPATSAALNAPYGVVLDASGNVYLSERFGHRIRKISVASGTITTVAGTGASSYSGDGGEATAAALYRPCGVTLDSSGNVYIGDQYNHRVRKVTVVATNAPTVTPTVQPTVVPSPKPTTTPTSAPTVLPTATPSTSPSTNPSLMPTLSPTATPSISPSSTYPTCTTSVRVYFVVTHVLAGVSPSLYSSASAANDAVLKQTVVGVIGYDCKVGDVTVQQVTGTAGGRSLSVADETTLLYSVNTPTRVINDVNQATALFIQALNESIVTGAFDGLLHAKAAGTSNSLFQSATTEYASFSTASPTSSPTSTPTFSPTITDIVAANLFAIPLDTEVTKAKVKYYLGTFVGYFLSIYICLYLYSLLRCGNATARKLYDSAHQSEAYIRHSSVANENMASAPILSDLHAKNALVLGTMRLEEDLKVVKQASQKYAAADGSKYSRGYREYVDQRRTLLGCSPFLFPDGYVVKIPCTSREVVFPPGRIENMLLYICHNHPLFSCFYFMDGSKLGAHGSRILYIGVDVAVFVLYQFSHMLLQYFMLDGQGLGTFINLFIITPSAVSVGLLLKYLYTCPFTETVEFQRRYAKYEAVVLFLGRLAIVPIMLIMGGSLILACLFSSNRRVLTIIANYFVYIQFYGVLLALAESLLLFIDGYYCKLSLFGVLDVLCIGQLYKERISAEKLVVDVDYAYRTSGCLCGLIKVQRILCRDDAIKAKWIKTVEAEQYDVEMKGAGSGEDSEYVVENPLASAPIGRHSIAFNIDTIYGADEESGGVVDAVNDAENPIHSAASYASTDYTDYIRHEKLRLRQSAINTAGDEAAVVDDDAALYLEYQNLQSQHDEAVYDLAEESSENAQVVLSFEEWKSNRKQFKQGTRGSFVRAFQIFEEREQLARDNLDQSASVQNTMRLFSPTAHNALASKGRPK